MTSRRIVLSFCVLAMASTAGSRVQASTDVEGAAYGGTTAGGWACGPVGRVNYAGVGARVRVSEQRARFGGSGVTGEVAAGGAYEVTSFVNCGSDCQSKTVRVMPPPGPVLGGHARVGYHAPWWGIEGGASAFQYFRHNTDEQPTTGLFPDAEVSLGNHDVSRVVIGIGSPTVTTLTRPGVYAGGDFGLSGVDWECRLGMFRAGPGEAGGLRGDVAALVPLTDAVKLRLGASASHVDNAGAGAEGSAGLRGTL